jgi:hypothetical protein
VSRETWYKWKRRYDAYGIGGLKDQSRKISYNRDVIATKVNIRGKKPLLTYVFEDY